MTENWIFGAAYSVIQLAGIFFALQAVLISRTPQAAIGWIVALVTLPLFAIPLFLIFGDSRFIGYRLAGTGESEPLDDFLASTDSALRPHQAAPNDRSEDAIRLNERLTFLPLTGGNRVDLLIDGAATFESIGRAIDDAKYLVVFQFFIIRDDGLGRDMQARLIAACKRGVRVFVLFDQVGSHKLPARYIDELNAAGARVLRFVTNRQQGKRFRINFRNHRKLVLVDGAVGFVGGHNVGDEYLGLSERFGPWRDTFMRVEGPAARALAVPFCEDWVFTRGALPDFPELPEIQRAGEAKVFSIPAGPASPWNVCPAALIEIIRSTRKRLWLASPYFVPDQALRAAIGHAALRGVDVRLLLPKNPDHLLPWLSSFTFYPTLHRAGVRVFRYHTGFMHQKIILSDDELAVVGSINLDYRSFILNFELSVGVIDPDFANKIEQMFLADFARADPEDLLSFEQGSLAFRLKCRAAALLGTQQ